jgi:hypothetical protein
MCLPADGEVSDYQPVRMHGSSRRLLPSLSFSGDCILRRNKKKKKAKRMYVDGVRRLKRLEGLHQCRGAVCWVRWDLRRIAPCKDVLESHGSHFVFVLLAHCSQKSLDTRDECDERAVAYENRGRRAQFIEKTDSIAKCRGNGCRSRLGQKVKPPWKNC